MDSKAVSDELIQQLNDFLKYTKAIMIAVGDVAIETVFSRYFEKRAPFGIEKKKDEFPDAFVLLALENWCQRQDKKLYVVSKDSDMKSFCEQSKCLIYLEKASDFTDIVIRSDEQQADFARDLLTRNESRIKEGITKQFEWFGFFIEDQDGDVEDVNVTDIDIDGENLIEVRDGTAKAELRATISFTADLTYDDLDTASYDSEDKVVIPWRQIEKTVSRETDVTVTLEFYFQPGDVKSFEITSLEVTTANGSDIGVSSEDDDGWPYK